MSGSILQFLLSDESEEETPEPEPEPVLGHDTEGTPGDTEAGLEVEETGADDADEDLISRFNKIRVYNV
eukprot:SAG11_NODE_1752_length_4316_cov_4.210576_5_plen_69_part_00